MSTDIHYTSDTPLKRCTKCQREFPATFEYFRKKKGRITTRCIGCARNSTKAHYHGWKNRKQEIQTEKEAKEKLRQSGIKVCLKCRRELPATLEYFFKGKKFKTSGLLAQCKECMGHAFIRRNAESQSEGFKMCRKCSVVYPTTVEFFYRDSATKDGWHGHCKECSNGYKKTEIQKQKHREYARVSTNRRRTKLKGLGKGFSRKDITLQYRAQKGKCWHCGCKLNDIYHADHLTPVAKGGSNDPRNIVLSCPACNMSKGSKLTHEWNGRLF